MALQCISSSNLTRLPKNFWESKSNQRSYFDWIAAQLGITKHESWYNITKREVKRLPRAASILKYYNDSLQNTLQHLYPDVPWSPTAWKQVSKHHWKDKQNQRQYFDWIASQLNIQSAEDWYGITKRQMERYPRASTIISHYYSNSLSKTLQEIYPEIQWKLWQFHPAPKHLWNDKDVIVECLHHLASKLNISHPREWLHVTRKQVIENISSGRNLLWRFRNDMNKLWQFIHPKEEWERSLKMSCGEKKAFACLKGLFPSKTVLLFPKLSFGELDFYVPDHSIAFEVQGKQHYTTASQQKRDEKKRQKCKELGISLIEIGYWWDGSLDSLMAKIQQVRPDIKLEFSADTYHEALEQDFDKSNALQIQ